MSSRSSKRRPAGSNRSGNPNGNRGPGRAPVATGGTESGEDPTALAQASVLATWAANSPQLEVEQGPWETVGQAQLDADPDELQEPQEVQFDPDLAFGLPQEPRVDPLPAGARVSDAGDSGYADPTTPAGSTGSSRAAGVPNPLQAKGRATLFTALAAAGFAAISGLLNDRLALDDEDETWLADEQDVDAVSTPAGRLIARKLPLPEGTDTSDLVDAIDIGIATAGYVLKNAMARARAVRERRRARNGAPVYQEG